MSFSLPEEFEKKEYKNSKVGIRHTAGATGELWYQVKDQEGNIHGIRYMRKADAKLGCHHYIDIGYTHLEEQESEKQENGEGTKRRLRIHFTTVDGNACINDIFDIDMKSGISEPIRRENLSRFLNEHDDAKQGICMVLDLAEKHVSNTYRNAHRSLEQYIK